jgi:hypothetical protein
MKRNNNTKQRGLLPQRRARTQCEAQVEAQAPFYAAFKVLLSLDE